MVDKIRLGISSCLLGNKVRYNGGHQLDKFIVETLGTFVDFVPVCPEVECGLSVPRETMRLVGIDPDKPRLMTSKTGIDHTERMMTWARAKIKELAKENLDGFIFKGKSPSSGMERVRVYHPDKNGVVGKSSGLFAKMFMEEFPLLPVEEDGRLHDMDLRENFIEQVFVYQRWRALRRSKPSTGDLVNFHTDHKLMLMAHSVSHYRSMGRLVAHSNSYADQQLADEYEHSLMAALRLKATVKKNTNVLQHMMGYFKNQLNSDEKKELLDLIEAYHGQLVPLIVPITLLNHYVRKFAVPYLARQHYLNPHPMELKLRNHA